ncbi:histidine phosphatase family protein [uncultured Pseudokineococcus sp.]|uniref:histidine phosphatase family protein n=1 Tax=uncultured Pseudokineococcus sp. TaxID=1642928 RepID=UPI00261E66A1|nr:histidine phosphatase family protein [uncultured Pseudokineococcus sp.]
MSPAQVVLWRHGQTTWNAEGRWQGHTDIPLSELGGQQVREAAAVLAEREPVRLVSSDLVRASATAGALALAADLPVALDPRLREVFGGDWQGLRRAEIESGWPELHAAWLAGEDVPPGGGERRTAAGARVVAAVEEHAASLADDEVLVVVGHGGALGAALLQLLGLPREAAPLLTGLRNARWTSLLRGTPGSVPWRLLEHNAGAWAAA